MSGNPAQNVASGSTSSIDRAGAVEAFFRSLDVEPSGRIGGAEAYAAFRSQRLVHGWPDLSPTEFGTHAKAAVEAVGGTKKRSNGMAYLGVKLPASWQLRVVSGP